MCTPKNIPDPDHFFSNALELWSNLPYTHRVTVFSGVILRSTVWVSAPSFVGNISEINSTNVLHAAFCVGSAVSLNIFIP